MTDALLQKLADAAGSEQRYWDIQGKVHERSPETARFLLKALGIPAGNDEEIIASLARLEEEPWRKAVPPFVVSTNGQAMEILLRLPDGAAPARWTLASEEGEESTGEFRVEDLEVLDRRDIDGAAIVLRRLVLPPQPVGYYRFQLETRDCALSRVIVSPEGCYLPPESSSRRFWGLTTQLYSLRSSRNWGIGDFSDLSDLARWAARQGADMIGINPLHALFLDEPQLASPYSPNSRLFLNPLYIDVTALPEYARLDEAQVFARSPDMQRALRAARDGDLIDYPAVAGVKMAVLEALYEIFQRGDAGSDQCAKFREFVSTNGDALQRFATFQMLSEHFRTHAWQTWPLAFRDPANAEVERLVRERSERMDFFKYLQWKAAEQRSDSARSARESGMKLGLYGDLAVGVETASADHWAYQDLFLRDLRIGAPPDPFNEAGQEWGLVPPDPRHLFASGYDHFSGLLRSNMRDAGVLRIDHVMGWQRLFLIPAGAPASEGFYLRYPMDDFVAIAALESRRNSCVVIGEDLGTVPAGFRERMAAANVLSTRVFYFEQEQGRFRTPDAFPKLASVSVTTHDLATLRGYWEMDDISAKVRLGVIDPQEEQFARDRRAWDKQVLLEALRQENLLPPEADSDGANDVSWSPALVQAVHLYLARSPSLLLAVQLDDLVGELHQANLPDSGDNANWRHRSNLSLEQLQGDITVSRILTEIARQRA